MASFTAQLDDALATRALLPPGATCLVAVSGGRDSMLLLRALAEWNRRPASGAPARRLIVGHFHHQLRGAEADADRNLVAAATADWGFPFVEDTSDVRACTRPGESLETAARRLRHAFLARAARDHGASRIATGHHADDQAELVLMRLLRGAGGRGLGGMGWIDPSPADPSLHLVRPLLGFSSRQLEQAAREWRVCWRHDASNDDPGFLRNRVRHELLPLLDSHYHAGVARILVREGALLRDQAEAIELAARRWLDARSREPFEDLPVAVGREIVRRQLDGWELPTRFDLVESLRLHPEAPVQIDPEHRLVRRADGRLEQLPPRSEPAFQFAEQWVRLEPGGPWQRAEFAGRAFAWQTDREDSSLPTAAAGWNRESFDAEAVGPTFRLRHWRPGDRFEPIGLGQAARLQDLFTNARIPPAERRVRVVAETADGRIFWVEGLRIGELARLRPATRRQLAWCWRPPEP